MRDAKPLAAPPNREAKARVERAGALAAALEARRVVFVDGAFVPELSELDALEPGLSIGSMASALAAGDGLVASHLGKSSASDIAVTLNTAFMGDGAGIRIGGARHART